MMNTKRMNAAILASVMALGLASSVIAEDEMGWDRGLALGLSLTDGNSETMLFNADIHANHKGEDTELLSGAGFSFGETTDQTTDQTETTTESAKGHVQLNKLFSDLTYGLIRVDASYDAVADVDYRVIVGPGLGRYLIKDEDVNLGVELGVVYITDKVGGVSDDAIALRIAQRYERALSESSKVWQSVEYLPQVDDFGTYLLKGEIGAEAALNSKMNLRVVAADVYDSEPAAGKDENDLSVTAALVYKI